MKTHPAFPHVSSRYGAPMGRPSTLPPTKPKAYHIVRATPTDQDYDQGGAYWGGIHTHPLYCAWSRDPDPEGFFYYFRADNRRHAIQTARNFLTLHYGE